MGFVTSPLLDRFDSRRSTVYGQNGVVATSQPLAAQAGIEMLQAGGNAFDAAVATAAALNVVEPTSTGIGGDVFALYRTADGEVGGMQACGSAPADATREGIRQAVADRHGLDPQDVTMPVRGPQTITVPGTARGWEATIERLGRMSFDEVLQPAIEYAMDGYPVSEVVAAQWQDAAEFLLHEAAYEAYLFDGESPTVGQTVRLPKLGRTLRRIAREGSDVIYEGEIARTIAGTVQAVGGFLTTDDLAGFEVEWPDPISTTYGGAKIFELPPYNAGMLALEALNIAAEFDIGGYAYDSPERTHYLAEATKLAFEDGLYHVTDPSYETVPELHSKEFAAKRAEEISESAIEDPDVGIRNAGHAEDSDTVLLCVADDEGNLVSYINSRFADFGSGIVAGDTGIALQNRGSAFSLDADQPNRFEPGKKPFHGLLPAVAQLGSDDWAAFGVMGGYIQPQGHLQVVSNLVDYDMALQPALDAPRFRYREAGTLSVEERMHDGVASELARRDHDVRVEPPSSFGGAQIVRDDDGTLSGATEPRKDGYVGVY
jgi:gamma-glutamyltranspeptidase/glutathione hydrolase